MFKLLIAANCLVNGYISITLIFGVPGALARENTRAQVHPTARKAGSDGHIQPSSSGTQWLGTSIELHNSMVVSDIKLCNFMAMLTIKLYNLAGMDIELYNSMAVPNHPHPQLTQWPGTAIELLDSMARPGHGDFKTFMTGDEGIDIMEVTP
ncbi:hypothetical protein PCASD_15093 [Puccinia coronata f. sp. avenae]|uniref:Uncharacterized protein n=1 Tax=Puccinia coronata f. sp. avenae TaxID=200324 RepID=A0A2N5T698_9BASI|nr:hypothetical protein PCASD_15093 [Puccinia coronata f. sp. avenae]